MRVNILLPGGKLGVPSFSGIYTAAVKFREKLREEGIDVDFNSNSYNYDIFHFQWPSPLLIPKLIKARKKGIKIINHAHTSSEDITETTVLTFNKNLRNLIGKYMCYFYDKADIILTPSNWSRECLIKGGVKKPITVLSNGIDTEKFKFRKEKRNIFREKYSLTNDDIVIYGVGILFLRKGLEIFKKTAEALPHLKFYWAGGKLPSLFIGERKKLLKIMNEKLDNLNFLGFVDDITQIHCGGDVFLFPSFNENQGIAVLEALACCKPSVVRNLPSYDWAIDEHNCLISKTKEDFINNVERLAENKRLRDKMGRNAIEAAKKHDIKLVTKKLINIYEGVLNS